MTAVPGNRRRTRCWRPADRVITYDRRGFGQSSRPSTGYDFDTLAADLSKLLTEFDLQDATLIGFSLGTGEVARYIGAYGTARLKSCVFIESLAPSFGRSDENPNGVDQATIDTIRQAIVDDRPAWLTGLLGDFLNLDDYLGKRVSEETVRNSWNAGAGASPWATWACVLTWLDDFHEDIKRIDIPALILHGTADRILSLEGQGRRMHAALPAAHYVEIEGGPHVMCVSHAKEVNRELLAFLGAAHPPAHRPEPWRPHQRPARSRRPTHSPASSSAPNSSTSHPQYPGGRSSRCSPRSHAGSSRAGTSTPVRKSGTSSPGRST